MRTDIIKVATCMSAALLLTGLAYAQNGVTPPLFMTSGAPSKLVITVDRFTAGINSSNGEDYWLNPPVAVDLCSVAPGRIAANINNGTFPEGRYDRFSVWMKQGAMVVAKGAVEYDGKVYYTSSTASLVQVFGPYVVYDPVLSSAAVFQGSLVEFTNAPPADYAEVEVPQMGIPVLGTASGDFTISRGGRPPQIAVRVDVSGALELMHGWCSLPPYDEVIGFFIRCYSTNSVLSLCAVRVEGHGVGIKPERRATMRDKMRLNGAAVAMG